MRIKELINGRYVKEAGWEPNYILGKGGKKISRINLMGAIVAKQNNENANYGGIVLDDGSGKISVREFQENKILDKVEIGDFVVIIGRPREYGAEKYVVPEIAKKITNEKWIEVRKLELEHYNSGESGDSEEEIEEVEELVESSGEIVLSQKIYNLIKEKDSGKGVSTEEIIKEHGAEAEKAVNRLLIEGEIFEIRPGQLKVLE